MSRDKMFPDKMSRDKMSQDKMSRDKMSRLGLGFRLGLGLGLVLFLKTSSIFHLAIKLKLLKKHHYLHYNYGIYAI